MIHPSTTTSDFIAGIKLLDADYLENFYDCYSTLLYSMIYRDVKDQGEAERLLEQVFCKLATSITLYKPGERFATWVILFTRNEIQQFLLLRNERQKKIDTVIVDLFLMHRAPTLAYAAS